MRVSLDYNDHEGTLIDTTIMSCFMCNYLDYYTHGRYASIVDDTLAIFVTLILYYDAHDCWDRRQCVLRLKCTPPSPVSWQYHWAKLPRSMWWALDHIIVTLKFSRRHTVIGKNCPIRNNCLYLLYLVFLVKKITSQENMDASFKTKNV